MDRRSRIFLSLALPVTLLFFSFALAQPQKRAEPPATPAELVSTYDQLATAILAVKNTEAHLVRSILATSYSHAQAALARARRELIAGDNEAAGAAVEELAAHVAQLGTEGDNAVAAIRKRLLEGGHHHNAEGEKQGIFDPGFVIVTRAAKKKFLESSRALGQLSRSPDDGALMREWKKVEAAWASLMKSKK